MKISYPYKNLVFKSKPSKDTLLKVKDFAKSGTPILFLGENGSGKKEYARLYHYFYWGKEEDFHHINSSNLDQEIGYSILFGYKKGAFTGAEENREGLIEKCESGTIYFSSIELLSNNLYSPILEAMEANFIIPLGSHEKKKLNTKILFSSRLPLKKLKEHLPDSFYFSIKPFTVKVPCLKERKEDILPIAGNILNELNKKYQDNKQFSTGFINFIKNYNFKGNIRELINFIKRAYIENIENKKLGIKNINIEESLSSVNVLKEALNDKITLKELEHRYILEIFRYTGGKRKNMSEILGISKRSVYNLLKKYGIISGKN